MGAPLEVAPLRQCAETAADTFALGRALGSLLRAGDFVALRGPLAAGKTTFVAGLAAGLGVEAPVTSPTYLLCQEYPGAPPLLHLDAYFHRRLEQLLGEGLAERLAGAVVAAAEWAEHIQEWLPPDRIEVSLEHRPVGREIAIRATGPGSAERLAALRRAVPAALNRPASRRVPEEGG